MQQEGHLTYVPLLQYSITQYWWNFKQMVEILISWWFWYQPTSVNAFQLFFHFYTYNNFLTSNKLCGQVGTNCPFSSLTLHLARNQSTKQEGPISFHIHSSQIWIKSGNYKIKIVTHDWFHLFLCQTGIWWCTVFPILISKMELFLTIKSFHSVTNVGLTVDTELFG